jgi:transcriptional regulator with XRE-family HTH domain
MPFFPIKGVIKRLRLERRWTREELAKKAGVKPRTVRLWESERIPRTGQNDTVRGFAAAFDVPNETIADWLDYDPDVDDLDEGPGGAPGRSTLAARAARDDVREWITSPRGELLELMRPRLLHRIKTAPGLCSEMRYAIAGKVRDHRDMPPIVGATLETNSNLCGQFLLVRRVHNGDVCYASLFTNTAEQTRRLLDAADAKEPVTVSARIVVKEPNKDFKGFFFFQKRGEKPKTYKWCLVADQILDGDVPVSYGKSEDGNTSKERAPKRRPKLPRSRSNK